MCGDPAGRVHDVKLAMLAAVIAGDECFHDLCRGLALVQQPDAIDAVERVGERLRRDRADAGRDIRHPATDRKILGCDRDTELPGGRVTRDEGPGHGPLIAPPRSLACRADWPRPCAACR